MQKSNLTNNMCEEIYKTTNEVSITSLREIVNLPTQIYLDKEIGHVFKTCNFNINEYYDNNYKLFIDSEEGDAIYYDANGTTDSRTNYQLKVFLSKIEIETSMKVLDYGAAKSIFIQELQKRFNITPYLYDVTETYLEIWKNKFNKDNYSVYKLKEEWKEKFDLVTSFYVFEHLSEPLKELQSIYKVLKKNGYVYLQVPFAYDHPADFLAIDHLSHFSPPSITYLLNKAGFEVLEIDITTYSGALIVIGQKKEDIIDFQDDIASVKYYNKQSQQILKEWESMALRIKDFNEMHHKKRSCIYGAGFYSTFILQNLLYKENIVSVVDQNKFLHHKHFFKWEILPINEITDDIEVIYVGVNPNFAKKAIEQNEFFKNKKLIFFYL